MILFMAKDPSEYAPPRGTKNLNAIELVTFRSILSTRMDALNIGMTSFQLSTASEPFFCVTNSFSADCDPN